MNTRPDSEAVRQTVRAGYGKIAGGEGSCGRANPTCGGGSTPEAAGLLAQHIGYSAGAVFVSETRPMAAAAGLEDIRLTEKSD